MSPRSIRGLALLGVLVVAIGLAGCGSSSLELLDRAASAG